MIWIFLGLALGIALGQGRLQEIGQILDSLVTSLVLFVGQFLESGLTLLEPFETLRGPLTVLALAFSVTAPGFLVALLVFLVKASQKARKIIAGILVIGGVLSFGFVDVLTASALIIAALVVASAARLITGPIVVMPLVTLAALTAYRYSALMLSGTDPVIIDATADMVALLPWLEPYPCRLAFIVLGVAPFFAAASALLSGPEKDKMST